MNESLIVPASVALIIFIVLSAFFSASETAYTGLSKIKLKNLAKDGKKNAETALELSKNYEKLLTTILIGNNLVNISASSICTWLFAEFLVIGAS